MVKCPPAPRKKVSHVSRVYGQPLSSRRRLNFKPRPPNPRNRVRHVSRTAHLAKFGSLTTAIALLFS